MAENNQPNNNANGVLKPPPPQTVPGVILYHSRPRLDEIIRTVCIYRESGFDVDTISKAIEKSQSSVFNYLRQIRLARSEYIATYPEEFGTGLENLPVAIAERKALDDMLRRELNRLKDDSNPSNRVGMLKLVMRNMRETEELRGLLVERIEHAGEITVKDNIKGLLDEVPSPVREGYLDALSAVIAAAERRATDQPSKPE